MEFFNNEEILKLEELGFVPGFFTAHRDTAEHHWEITKTDIDQFTLEVSQGSKALTVGSMDALIIAIGATEQDGKTTRGPTITRSNAPVKAGRKARVKVAEELPQETKKTLQVRAVPRGLEQTWAQKAQAIKESRGAANR